MLYDINQLPGEVGDLEGFYLSKFEDDIENDGEAMTYNEPEFDEYRRKVISRANDLTGHVYSTETDDVGVYLTLIEDN